jgi:hypothetical protein
MKAFIGRLMWSSFIAANPGLILAKLLQMNGFIGFFSVSGSVLNLASLLQKNGLTFLPAASSGPNAAALLKKMVLLFYQRLSQDSFSLHFSIGFFFSV